MVVFPTYFVSNAALPPPPTLPVSVFTILYTVSTLFGILIRSYSWPNAVAVVVALLVVTLVVVAAALLCAVNSMPANRNLSGQSLSIPCSCFGTNNNPNPVLFIIIYYLNRNAPRSSYLNQFCLFSQTNYLVRHR